MLGRIRFLRGFPLVELDNPTSKRLLESLTEDCLYSNFVLSTNLEVMSLVKLRLQLAKAEQLPQVVELDKLSLGGLWTLEGYRRELASPNSNLLVMSVVNVTTQTEEQVIGCGCFWAILEEAHITLLAIHPDYQRRGLGKLLLYALLKDAVKRKLERATLEVRESNQVALSVYQKFGFKTAGRRKGYYQKTGEDALILWRGDLHYPSFKQELETWQQQIENKLLEQGFSSNFHPAGEPKSFSRVYFQRL